MPRNVLTRSAVDKLLADPKLRIWRKGELGRERPVLWYVRRATSIRHGTGVRTEHGDGFSLTFCEPEDLEQVSADDCVIVTLTDGLDILVVAGKRHRSGSLLIGWRTWTYTCELLDV